MSAEGWGAMSVRSPLIRHRPWVSDTRWVAHESLQLFSHIAGIMPSNGWWKLGQDGALPIDGPHNDLTEFMANLNAEATPCVVLLNEYQRNPDRDQAMQAAATQMVEVLDAAGVPWLFDQGYIEVASLGQPGWSWKIAAHGDSAVLVGVDRKDRPRFAVMSRVAS